MVWLVFGCIQGKRNLCGAAEFCPAPYGLRWMEQTAVRYNLRKVLLSRNPLQLEVFLVIPLRLNVHARNHFFLEFRQSYRADLKIRGNGQSAMLLDKFNNLH